MEESSFREKEGTLYQMNLHQGWEIMEKKKTRFTSFLIKDIIATHEEDQECETRTKSEGITNPCTL